MGYIYKITSPSGKIYIGQAKYLRKRINAHRNSMKRKWTNIILINSFKKHGFDEHYFQIIEECDNATQMRLHEMRTLPWSSDSQNVQ